MHRKCPRLLSVILVVFLPLAGVWAQEAAEDLPDLENTGVVVPWSDFKTILDDLRVGPEPTPVPPPPVDHAFSECRITATADREDRRLQVEMRFSIQVLKDEGWVEVRVAPENLALDAVAMDGAPARLYTRNGFRCVAVQGRARHDFVLRALVPVVRTRGRWTARLQFPPSPVVSLEAEVQGADRSIEIDSGVVRSLGPTRAGGTRLVAALTNRGSATLEWFRDTPADSRESSVFADVATLLVIGEGSLRGTTSVTAAVHGQGVTSFGLELPDDLVVLDVIGQGVAGWKAEEAEEGRQKLTVSLAFPAEGVSSFEVEFERSFDAASAEFSLPDIVVEGVRRERGHIAVAAATNVEITHDGEIRNAAAVDPSEMPAVLARRAGADVVSLFKYLRHPVEIPLKVLKHEDLMVKRTIVEKGRLTTFLNPRGRRLTSAVYTVKNNRKQFLAARLPEGSTLWGAFRAGVPVKAALREDGAVLVPLKKTSLGSASGLRPFDVEIIWFEEGRRSRPVEHLAFAAPALDVDCLELTWRIFTPRERRFLAFGGNLDLQTEPDFRLVDGRMYVAGKAPAAPADKRLRDGEQQMVQEYEESRDENLEGLASQVLSSNVALGDSSAVQGVGGRARGVLPVRVAVPEIGLELEFSGRLVTAEEVSTFSMMAVPASWRGPRFGPGWTGFLAFLLVFVGGTAVVIEAKRKTAVMTAIVVLAVCLFFVSGGHRTAFVIGVVIACLLVWVLRWFRNREPGIGDGF